jgi:hypothetical protein
LNIHNNRFDCFITEDWNKKDWIVNLIPLGGIASVAYEIGSACLSSKERTAKIADDFFKSPIQTILKKTAQCLWLPIVICGALKLVCFSINACWNRCFPPERSLSIKTPSSKKSLPITRIDFCKEHSSDIALHIFSHLTLHELGLIKRVSKRWCEVASHPLLWKTAIYREIAFSSKDWMRLNADFAKDTDLYKEMLSLPEDIAEELGRSASNGKHIKDTHILVIKPKGLTINTLGVIAKQIFTIHNYGYTEIDIDKEAYSYEDGHWFKIGSIVTSPLGNQDIEKAEWLLMTKNILPGSLNKSFDQNVNMMSELAKARGVRYEVPNVLQAATCMLAEYSRSKKYLFYDESMGTLCRDGFVYDGERNRYLVGKSILFSEGISVYCSKMEDDHCTGVAGIRTFGSSEYDNNA